MANPLASDIIGLARNLLRSESTSDVPVIQDTFMLSALSDGNLKWARAFRQSGEEPIVFQREFGIDLVPDTTLAAPAATTDITLTLTTSASYSVSGTVVVWDDNMPDIIPYTGNNLTGILSGVTGIGFAHETGDGVQCLYALPSDFGTFRQSVTYGDGVVVNGVPLFYMGGPPLPGFFSLYDDGTTKFLWLSRGITGSASVLYDKSTTDITSVDDIVDVPLEYKFFLVFHLVSFGVMGREQDVNTMVAMQNQSNMVLKQALQDRNIGNKKVRTRPFGAISKDYTTINGQYVSFI